MARETGQGKDEQIGLTENRSSESANGKSFQGEEREGKGGDVIPIKRKTSLNFIRESVVTVCGGVSRVTRRREEKFSLYFLTETDVSGT